MTSTAKYLILAQQVIAQIEQGKIAQNTKLPSLRLFCQLHNISMTTALTCYRYLETHDYAIAENKKGYYAHKPANTLNNAAFPLFKSRISSGDNRAKITVNTAHEYSLATAQLDAQLIDKNLIKRCLIASTKQSDFALNYDEPSGNAQLRMQLSKHCSTQGFSFLADELVITHGCLDAILIAIESVSKIGDVIAITSPCYSGLLDILSLLNRDVIEIPSTANGLALEQLEHALKNHKIKACLLTANHQNPTGHNLNNQQKQDIVKLAEKYKTPIIEDDVFRELSHDKPIPLPIKHFDTNGWVIWCNSVSKTLAPGLRIGWCLPGKFIVPFQQQRMTRTLGQNQPIQLALAEYIRRGFYQAHLKKVNRTLIAHATQYIEFLHENLPEKSDIFIPNGGLVLWIRIIGVNTEKLTARLLEEDIHIKYGNLFSTTNLYQDCLRLNIGLIPNKHIYAQLLLLCKLAKKMQKRSNKTVINS